MPRALPLPYARGGHWWADFKRLKAGRRPLVPEGQTMGLQVAGPQCTKSEREANVAEAMALLQRDWNDIAAKQTRQRTGISDAEAGVPRALLEAFLSWKSELDNDGMVSAKELGAIRRGCEKILALNCTKPWTHISQYNSSKALKLIVAELRKLKKGKAEKEKEEKEEGTKEDEKKKKKKVEYYASATIRQWCMDFCGLLSYAKDDDLISGNNWYRNKSMPSGRALDAKGRRIEQHFLTPFEVKAVLAVVDAEERAGLSHRNPYLRDIVYCLAYTGARREEIMRLRLGDCDFDRNLMLIRGTKTGEETREVPMWKPLKVRLLPYRKTRNSRDLLFPSVGARGGKNDSRTTGHLSGDRKPMVGIAKGLKRVMLAAGVPPEKFLSPYELAASQGLSGDTSGIATRRARGACHHVWRHSYAMVRVRMMTRAPGGGFVRMSEHLVAKELGHSSEKQIRATYTNRVDRIDWPVSDLDFTKAPKAEVVRLLSKGSTAASSPSGARPRGETAARVGRAAQASSPKRPGRTPRSH